MDKVSLKKVKLKIMNSISKNRVRYLAYPVHFA